MWYHVPKFIDSRCPNLIPHMPHAVLCLHLQPTRNFQLRPPSRDRLNFSLYYWPPNFPKLVQILFSPVLPSFGSLLHYGRGVYKVRWMRLAEENDDPLTIGNPCTLNALVEMLNEDFPSFMLRKILVFTTFPSALCWYNSCFLLGKSLFSTRFSPVAFIMGISWVILKRLGFL